MIVRAKAENGRPIYKAIRGPDGARYANWCAERGKRALERYGYDVTGSPFEAAAHRRVMRNARKRERAMQGDKL